MADEKRLIDANALMERLKFKRKISEVGLYRGLESAMAQCAKAPTVDAVEVVHGRWKYYHKQNIAVCTNCSFERDLDVNFGRAVSCPNCGADMRERKGNET